MATTSLQGGGYPGRPYGSFAGKEFAANGPHNPGRITTLWGYGGPGHLHGSFAGKEQSIPQVIAALEEESGVRGRKRKQQVIRLSDMSDANARKRAADYIKAQVALRTEPPKIVKQTKAQRKLADLAARNMAIEAETEERLLIDNNNRILLILLGSE